MSTGFKEESYSQTFINPKIKIMKFLEDFRDLLDKHKAKIYTSDCELYIDGLGFIGNIEDNIETLEIVDGNDILYSTEKSKKKPL